MKSILRAAVVGFILSLSLAPVAWAAENAPAAAKASQKVGDKVYVCGCGKACTCNTMQATPGKCHCGKDLVEGTVTKVEGADVTVKTAAGDQVFHAK